MFYCCLYNFFCDIDKHAQLKDRLEVLSRGQYQDMGKDPNPGSVVSPDHADESLAADTMGGMEDAAVGPRVISADDIEANNSSEGGSFWAVVDNFVVDATDFLDSHPGGLKKLLATDSAAAGATGNAFGFSFSKGKNAHFPGTGKIFKEGVKLFLAGAASADNCLVPRKVEFPKSGRHAPSSITILGRLAGT